MIPKIKINVKNNCKLIILIFSNGNKFLKAEIQIFFLDSILLLQKVLKKANAYNF